MLSRLSSILLPSLFLSSVLGLDEGSCSKDGDKEDCGAKTENKFKYSTLYNSTLLLFNCWLFRKTVLVTGGSGFVAHHVIEAILDNTDWNVVSLDRYRGYMFFLVNYFLPFIRLDLSGKLNRLDEMLGQKGESFKKRVRVIYADLRADINDQLAKDIGDIQVITLA